VRASALFMNAKLQPNLNWAAEKALDYTHLKCRIITAIAVKCWVHINWKLVNLQLHRCDFGHWPRHATNQYAHSAPSA